MRWQMGRRSGNVDDRRGAGGGRTMLVGGGLSTVVIVVVAMLLGVDPRPLLEQAQQQQDPYAQKDAQAPSGSVGVDDELKQFVSVVLADTEDTWHALLDSGRSRYREPKLVLFTDAVQSACGFQESAVGPFYCPGDFQVYLDLGFFRELEKLGAPGDFAQAYVIAHEIGHHVQNLLGLYGEKRSARSRSEANAASVRVELQADCFAGVWAHHAAKERNMLEPGDLEEGLRAAAAIGDDTLQRRAGGRIAPESFTHGSSEQRLSWFKRGFDSGSPEACNTSRE